MTRSAPTHRDPLPSYDRPLVTVPESLLRALLLAAKEAAVDLADIGKLARIPATENPKVRRLVGAIHFVEKAAGKRANEMKGEAG